MPKKSKSEAAETRKRIVKTAASEFRRGGITETGLTGFMSAAGLSQGGFYRHFRSKSALVAEAVESAVGDAIVFFERDASGLQGSAAINAVVSGYLSQQHRDHPGFGCILAANGSEMARSDVGVREAATDGISQIFKVLGALHGGDNSRQEVVLTFSAMVGALMLSRIVSDPNLSTEIMEKTRAALMSQPES